MIRVDNLTVRYGSLTAVDRLSLDVASGALFGLIGSNGAGKTTTLKVVSGLLLPAEGTVRVNDLDVVNQRHAVQASIGYMADFFGVYDYLTAVEYLTFFGALYGLDEPARSERVDRLLEMTNLAEKRDAGIRELSRGMKQRLYFARALVHDPDVLILDEPASGMDPRGRADMSAILRDLHRAGKTIVISSHILGELEDLCTSIGVLERGKLVGTRSLREGGLEQRVTVMLHVHPGDLQKTGACLDAMPGIDSMAEAGNRFRVTVSGGDDAVSVLIGDLVRAGVRLRLPHHGGDRLQDVFMKMTKGELM